ncbi:DUF3027 domain-containing protein [Nocardia asteroides]
MSAVSVSESGVRPILADAVDLARRALLELEPSAVGAHLGVIAEDEVAATHRFEATLPGYRGWQWAVVVAAPPGADHATVSESALLPGPEALVAPEFVPWEQRVRPGDLAPGDLLAPPADDPRLVPGYVATGDPVVDEVAYQVGLGRTKVMSREGREAAAERWYAEYGPDSEMAKAAPATCGSCGFYLPLAGALRAAFGVCGNAMGADGHVVHVAYGCGAHSDTEVPTGSGSPLHEAYDDAAIELITFGPDRSAARDAAASTSTGADRGPAEASSAPEAAAEEAGNAENRAKTESVAAVDDAGVAVGGPVTGDAAVENRAVAQDVAVDAGNAEGGAVVESGAAAQDAVTAVGAGVAESAAGVENRAAAQDVAAADTGVAQGGVVTGDVAGVEDAAAADAEVGESGSVTEGPAGVGAEGVAAVESPAAAEDTVGASSAPEAGPTDSPDTTAGDSTGYGKVADAVPAAEVGEIDPTSVASASSAVREKQAEDAAGESARAGGTGFAVPAQADDVVSSDPSVAKDDISSTPEHPTGTSARDFAPSESDSDAVQPLTGATQDIPAESGTQASPAEPVTVGAASDTSASSPAGSPVGGEADAAVPSDDGEPGADARPESQSSPRN